MCGHCVYDILGNATVFSPIWIVSEVNWDYVFFFGFFFGGTGAERNDTEVWIKDKNTELKYGK